MAARNDLVVWTVKEERRLAKLTAQGVTANAVAEALNREFHGNRMIRTTASVQLKRGKLGLHIGPRPKHIVPMPERQQSIEQTENGDGIEARANGARIKTVDDLIRHIKADMTRFDIAASEATKYEVATKDPVTGKVSTTELHRVFVRLKPKAGPSIIETVEAMIAGAFANRQPIHASQPKKVAKPSVPTLLQALVLADPHIGKYAWAKETGWEDYDIGIATRLIRESVAELLDTNRQADRLAFWCLGDILHYDTPTGTTTKGTPLDRDGRIEKMLEEAVAALCDVITEMSRRAPVDVVLVPGNHDAVMTVALRQILTAEFRKHPLITINTTNTTRKYITHGRCLIGLTHGDKAQKNLGELMALEARSDWGQALLREVHHGHRHSEAAITTVAGVTIRQHPALCPPDGWHAAEGYVGAPRAMDSYVYHADGYLVGMTRATVKP